MLNPLDIEQRYQDLKLLLSLPSTPYQRVTALGAFLTLLHGEERSYESYVLECHERLPAYLNELPACGYVPDRLHDLYAHLLTLQCAIPAAVTITGVPEAMQRFRNVVAVHFAHAGAWDRVLDLYSGPTPGHASPAASYPAGIEGFNRLVHDHAVTGRMTVRECDAIRQLLSGTAEGREHAVLIPVVEKPVTGEGAQSGSLRRISVRILGEAGAARDTIETDIAEYGVDHAERSQVGIPMQAVRQWLGRQHSPAASKWYLGHVSFGGAHELLEGGSSGLAVAVALACEILRYENTRMQYRIHPDAVLSGVLDSDGTVLAIDADTLRLKVEATFFSSAAVLVLPRSQVEVAEYSVQELRRSYPVRKLEIIGVRTLADAFFDLRIMQQSRASILLHAARTIRGRKSRTAAIISTSILLFIAAWFALGPIDQEPNAVTYQGDRLRVLNRFDRTIAEITVGNATVENWGHFATQALAQKGFSFGDADGDGKKDLFYIQSAGPDSGEVEQVCAWSIKKNQLLWRSSIAMQYDFPDKPETKSGWFNCIDLVTADSDGEGFSEVFVSAHHTPSFPGIILRFNGRTGSLEQAYVHAGHISDIAIADLNGDGEKELLVCGTNNAFNQAFVAALNPQQLTGSGPASSPYTCSFPDRANERFYVLIPRSILGSSLPSASPRNQAKFLTIREDRHEVTVAIDEGVDIVDNGRLLAAPILNFTFSSSANLLSVSQGDSYLVAVDWALSRGMLAARPAPEELQNIGQHLRIWREGIPVVQ